MSENLKDCVDIEDERLNTNPMFTKICAGYVSVKGVTLPGNFKQVAEKIENFEVYDDDVWVCTFPKCGTTWMQELTWLIVNDFDYKGATQWIDFRFPFIDAAFLLNQEDQENALEYGDYLKFAGNIKRPRCIKTHLPYFLLPKQIQDGSKKPKIIFVFRNPKDVCVSYYHHYCFLHGYRGTLEEFVELFVEGKLLWAPFWENVLSYQKLRGPHNFFSCTYEEMKKDLTDIIRKVARFLEKDVSEEQLHGLLEHLHFEKMRSNKALSFDKLAANRKVLLQIDNDESFFRRGTVGSYKEELSEQDMCRLDDWIRKNGGETELKA